jgi:chromosome segregation ATPase
MKNNRVVEVKETPSLSGLLELVRQSEKKYRIFSEVLPVIEEVASLQALVAELKKASTQLDKKIAGQLEEKKAGEDVLLSVEKELLQKVVDNEGELRRRLAHAKDSSEKALKKVQDEALQKTSEINKELSDLKERVIQRTFTLETLQKSIEEKTKELNSAQAGLDAFLSKLKG